MTGRVYLDPGDGLSGRYDPPRLCRVLIRWRPGATPRNVAVEYLADSTRAVIPFTRRLRLLLKAAAQGRAVTVPVSPQCDTGRHLDCDGCDCTCHPQTTQYQPPRREGETT